MGSEMCIRDRFKNLTLGGDCDEQEQIKLPGFEHDDPKCLNPEFQVEPISCDWFKIVIVAFLAFDSKVTNILLL